MKIKCLWRIFWHWNMTLIMVKCYNVVGRTVVSEQGMQAWQESAYYLHKVFKSWQVNSCISCRGYLLSKHYDWLSFSVGRTCNLLKDWTRQVEIKNYKYINNFFATLMDNCSELSSELHYFCVVQRLWLSLLFWTITLGLSKCNFYLIKLRIPLQLPTWKLQVGRVVMQPADRPQMESFVISFD